VQVLYNSITRCTITVAEILEKVKFVINPGGKKTAVMVDMHLWEQIVTILEDFEDAEELKQARAVHEESIPWSEAKKDLDLGE
jgi:hypothetical protein